MNAAPVDSLRAISNTIVGLCNAESGQMICLGFVAGCTESVISVIIPPNIPEKSGKAINHIVRGEMNWSPRDGVCHKGRITSTDFLPLNCDEYIGRPNFLGLSLRDDTSGATKPSTRTNLRRKRLMRSPRD